MEIGEGRRFGRAGFFGTLPGAAQPGESVAPAHAGAQKCRDSRLYGQDDLRLSKRGGVDVQPDCGLSNRTLNKPGAWLTVTTCQRLPEYSCCFVLPLVVHCEKQNRGRSTAYAGIQTFYSSPVTRICVCFDV